ncbi:MAG: membrane protein insertase YidC [Alphaproteobacteria bacterium]|nr:membrane protein insertase YidC [Alphaproteobacteria bacterium]
MKDELKSLSWAILLSFAAIYSVNYFFGINKQSIVQEQIAETKKTAAQAQAAIIAEETSSQKLKSAKEVLEQDRRLSFQNGSVSGSIRLKGARFDDLYLTKYNVSLDDNSSKVELLKPAQTANHYFADLGWLSLDKSLSLPSSSSLWQSEEATLEEGKPVTLTWNNDNGLKIVRKITLDKNYLFTVQDTVINTSDREVELFPYALINRNIEGYVASRSVVHEGMSAVIDNTLKEFKFNDLDKNESETFDTKGGWLGFSDRYWFVSLVLGNKDKAQVTLKNNGDENYQIDYLGSRMIIPAHQSETYTYNLFAGAKEIKLLDAYTKKNGFSKFDLAVDFGWYYFLTKPFFYILDFLYGFLGNMGWAILLFAALLRLCMFPIANKSYTNMAKMKALQPKLTDIRNKYADNPQLIQKATLDLYKKEKVNPASGCLPMLIQIPIFFSLYKVLNISIEIRHAPFVGWIKDLSAPDPMTLSQMLHIYVPGFIDIGLWPIFMGFTMWMQQKLNPAPVNKDQAMMFALMPVFFTFMLGHFASGLVIYWTLSNILSIIQQKTIMKKNGVN